MGTFTDAQITAFEAIEAMEIKREGRERWNQWLADWKDENGQTPFGFYVDVYDVMSDYIISADQMGLDFSLTWELVDMALDALANGGDPYNIQMQIDEKHKVYVDEGHITIGKIVITGECRTASAKP